MNSATKEAISQAWFCPRGRVTGFKLFGFRGSGLGAWALGV